MKKTRYYESFTDDFEQSARQDFQLPEGYQWVRTDPVSKAVSGLIYAAAVILGGAYCKFFLHMKVRGRNNLKGMNGAFFLYGNHTQPVGDVFLPALCVLPKRIYTVVSSANYGIPIIGRLLPYLGALPIRETLSGLRELSRAMEQRLEQGHPIVIYPEAHVWEYATQIRPFPETSFKFPVKFNKPTFVMTVTYRKGRLWKRPIMEVFLDGPLYPRGGSVREQTADLHAQVCSVMQERSKNSNVSYIAYIKKEQST